MNLPERGRADRLGAEGSTLIEMLAAIGLLVLLAATVVPSLTAARDSSRVATSARDLADLADAIHNPDAATGSFEVDIGRYPLKLEHLTRQIITGDQNSCSRDYVSGDIIPDKWQGPYVSRIIDDSGFPIGIGTVQNEMRRDDPFPTRNSRLRIVITEVDGLDASALDAYVDYSDGSSTGAVQWGSPDAEGLVEIEYVLNVTGC